MSLALIGWAGTLIYLLGHAYISLQPRWKPLLYYGGNFIAGSSLVASSLALGSWQAVVINGFWAGISLAVLGRVSLARLGFARIWLDAVFVALLGAGLAAAVVEPAWAVRILGWSSAVVFCAGYLLFSAQRLPPQGYFLYNAYAASALLPQLIVDANWPVFVLEACWAVLSLYAWSRRRWQFHLLE